VIDSILEDDRTAPRKQRHTAHRIWERLVVEHQAEIAEVSVRPYVAGRMRIPTQSVRSFRLNPNGVPTFSNTPVRRLR
jgi:hypothetical protein